MTFGCFGGLTPEKRLPQILDAFPRRFVPTCQRRACCSPVRSAEHYDLMADVRGSELQDPVVITGYLETDEQLTDCIAAVRRLAEPALADRRESVGTVAPRLAAGQPTIIMDLAHLADVPSLDPRTWSNKLAVRAAGRNR